MTRHRNPPDTEHKQPEALPSPTVVSANLLEQLTITAVELALVAGGRQTDGGTTSGVVSPIDRLA